MNLAKAAQLVCEDQRKNAFDDINTDRERIDYVRNVFGLPGQGPSNWQIEDDGRPISNAYIAVLKATDVEVGALNL